jgi:hypothetical protein
MKSKPEEKNKRATNHPTQHHWHEMNRKQRRETVRKMQSEDLSLEVVQPDAAGIDISRQEEEMEAFHQHPQVHLWSGVPRETEIASF